jgi:hypothetical protein
METFLVRLWTPVDGEECQPGGPPLHGVVEQVGRDGSQTFWGDRELVMLLRAGLRPENRRQPRARSAR